MTGDGEALRMQQPRAQQHFHERLNAADRHQLRSEERRVGKERTSRHTRCLSDWSSDVCSSDLRTTRWLSFFRGSDRGRTISWPLIYMGTFSRFSRNVFPVTVRHSGCSSPALSSNFMSG